MVVCPLRQVVALCKWDQKPSKVGVGNVCSGWQCCLSATLGERTLQLCVGCEAAVSGTLREQQSDSEHQCCLAFGIRLQLNGSICFWEMADFYK